MSFFETVSQFFSIVWDSCKDFPILNTGLVFKDLFFGFIGFSVLVFLFKSFFGFSGSDSVVPFVGSRSRRENLSESRRYDER